MIKPGRPRTTVTPEQVRKLVEGRKVMTWAQVASELKMSTATAMRLYRQFREAK